jgi:hypothetical protein
MEDENPEIAYYRRVEDLFSSLRGTPHILSPRDFQLLRSWWRDDIPFAAVSAGLNEVFARNRDRDDAEPVVSLSYCRHAVKSHARRIASMHVGSRNRDPEPPAADNAIEALSAALSAAARRFEQTRPAVAAVLQRTTEQVIAAGAELPADLLDEQLYNLESAMMIACWESLDHEERAAIEARIAGSLASSTTSDEARQRSRRALRDRELRLLLDLPRLELGG